MERKPKKSERLRRLEENSIRLSDAEGPIDIVWVTDEGEETVRRSLHISELMQGIRSKYSQTRLYDVNFTAVAFVDGDEYYVTPYTRDAVYTLSINGFHRKPIYVPFSSGEYPKGYFEKKWKRLQKMAQATYENYYECDSANWCDEHDIKKLSHETLANCLRVPPTGIPVKRPGEEEVHVYYPILSERFFDFKEASAKLGRYRLGGGKGTRVVFVYRDGHTYVTKGKWIIDELERAGYRTCHVHAKFEASQDRAEYCRKYVGPMNTLPDIVLEDHEHSGDIKFDVPLSRDERIVDPEIAAKWAQIDEK